MITKVAAKQQALQAAAKPRQKAKGCVEPKQKHRTVPKLW